MSMLHLVTIAVIFMISLIDAPDSARITKGMQFVRMTHTG